MRARPPKTTERRAGLRRNIVAIATTVVIGLLLWARLIVITDMPRTAIADDDAKARSAARRLSGWRSSDKPAGSPVDTQLDRDPNRDPFRLPQEQSPKQAVNSDIPAEPEKSTAQVTEDPR